ncbi:phospholipase D/nuclease [Aureobasidium sp. EXF-12298]|nr:phospholipase D/nuclease [Aureobasidium sp. EXF-12298]KAI4753956.1 phospholipase D/nuclease [Aureobasidium sp. EXF-12344]KAI4771095.1 phospholipase D/nuclease [Aureobasidium sp. EXF-3400]
MAGIPGLDRRAMEAERLARLAAKRPSSTGPETTTMQATTAKRQRSISPPPTSRPAKKIKEQSDASSSLQYPRGTVKKTWAFGHARANDIKIEEVLERSTLRTALLSAFQWETDWIMAKLNLQQTKVIMVMQADNEAVKQQYRQETAYLGMINCMHSKLMLLFHPHKLRVVVPSANLTSYDWGEQGIMENSVFLVDLPRLEDTALNDASSLPQFGRELLFFLEKKGCDDDILKGVLNFDFSNTQGLAFVHSVGGTHYGEDMERTGYVGLSTAIRELHPASQFSICSQSNLQIDYPASSMGSLNDEFLTIMHNAARGEDATATPATTSRTAPKPFQDAIPTTKIREDFRIYFPTHSTVATSTGGVLSGGTICHRSEWWNRPGFPRECFRDYRSKRPGMLSHNKIMYARGINEKGEQVAWRYSGSANLSESAWGKLSWDRKNKEWKIGCRNWECGVILPVLKKELTKEEQQPSTKMPEVMVLSDDDAETESEVEDASTDSDGEAPHKNGKDKKDTKVSNKKAEGIKSKPMAAKAEVPDMSVFGPENIPFEYPGAAYDGKDPWFFMG